MRPTVHNTTARFRVNEALMAKAEKTAARRGMTVSELMRDVLRRELEAA